MTFGGLCLIAMNVSSMLSCLRESPNFVFFIEPGYLSSFFCPLHLERVLGEKKRTEKKGGGVAGASMFGLVEGNGVEKGREENK